MTGELNLIREASTATNWFFSVRASTTPPQTYNICSDTYYVLW